MLRSSLIILFLAMLCFSCKEDYVPKPKGYNRIDLPPHAYQKLEEKHPYTFEYSKAAVINKDTNAIAEADWIEINYPDFKAKFHITYKPVKNKPENLEVYFNDSHRLKGGHQKKAYAIDEYMLPLPNGMNATLFELQGEVPSQFQFYVTDSTKHFLRGALYFRTATKNDSLAPVIEYLKDDAIHMLKTLEWTN